MPYRNFNHPAFRELTFGTGGVGKTTAFIERLKKQKAAVIWIFDHKQEFCRKLNVPRLTTAAQVVQATARGGIVCYDPSGEWPGLSKLDGFRWFCEFCYASSEQFPGRKILACDELQKLIDTRCDPVELGLCVDDGRCRGLDFMAITHGANRIHTLIRQQVIEAYTFVQTGTNSVKILEDDYGFNGDEVRGLRPGEWLWRNTNTGQARRGGSAFEIKSPRKGSLVPPAPGPAVETGGERNANQPLDPENLRQKAVPESAAEQPGQKHA